MLRAARVEDLDAIAQLEDLIFQSGAWSPEMVKQELSAPDRTYLVCELNQRIVAYGGCWHAGPDAEIMTLAVAEDYRRQGIAKKLLTGLLDKARQAGSTRALLEVRVDNEQALSLYRSFGFEQIGLRRRYYQPEDVDAYTMALVLESDPSSPVIGRSDHR